MCTGDLTVTSFPSFGLISRDEICTDLMHQRGDLHRSDAGRISGRASDAAARCCWPATTSPRWGSGVMGRQVERRRLIPAAGRAMGGWPSEVLAGGDPSCRRWPSEVLAGGDPSCRHRPRSQIQRGIQIFFSARSNFLFRSKRFHFGMAVHVILPIKHGQTCHLAVFWLCRNFSLTSYFLKRREYLSI